MTAVRRISLRRNYQIIPAKHVILTFDRSALSVSVNAGFMRCPVRPYVPDPCRCFKCQWLGHGTTSCLGKLTCAKCEAPDHPTDYCESVNCPWTARCLFQTSGFGGARVAGSAVAVVAGTSFGDAAARSQSTHTGRRRWRQVSRRTA